MTNEAQSPATTVLHQTYTDLQLLLGQRVDETDSLLGAVVGVLEGGVVHDGGHVDVASVAAAPK